MSIDSELKKGALVNFIGVIGKMAAPAFLIVVNRFYGPDVFGIYITANIAVEIIIAFLTSGFKDGALIFVARFADDKGEQKDLYNALANAFSWSIGFSALVLLVGIIFGQDILEFAYREDFNQGLSIMFQFMLLAIPLMAFERVVLAATQGLKIMKYDALSNGWLRPLALLGFSILFWFLEPNLTGMALAYLSTQVLLFFVSVWIYSRELSWMKLFHGFRTFRVDKELLDFAIPQNINMTLNRFITGIDVLMLPAFGFSPTIVGFYGAGSMIIREVKAIKMVFSTAFAPYIVRFHKEGQSDKLSHNFSKTAGWIATLAIPTLLLIAIFKQDLLAIIHPEYGGASTFMFFLLPIPYMYCSFSLAGNIVAMTGHSKLTLLNSIFVSAANVLMNLALIPMFGIIGAAIASAIATITLHSLELGEARWIADAKLYLKDIYKPHAAGLISAITLAFCLFFVPWFSEGLIEKIVLATIVLGIFGALLGGDYIRRVQKKLKNAT
ncbi:MAG: polysaccharide biosynthesis C-terminal domain-containing protein [Gracilimonas sp.]|uniref:oligosaccharide flippase family protein n=1 Tax=Gracilimonas sp. TaxID=1974203 RepID=UPI003750B198|nr:polysaccharide biosynthesis C-terminal domain-containing protein [Gracilimonas sp.]